MYILLLAEQENSHISALCGKWKLSRGLSRAIANRDGWREEDMGLCSIYMMMMMMICNTIICADLFQIY